MDIYTTKYKNGKISQQRKKMDFTVDVEVENELINVFPHVRYQTWAGFGATFTEAACYCLEQLGEDAANEIIDGYYGKDGLRYTYGRVHLDSCDAALGNYCAMNDPYDTELKTFSIDRDEKLIIPVIKKAQNAAGGRLSLMLSPWSPPPFMKTNGEKNNGGKLKPEYNELWAKYICRYIKEYEKHGISFEIFSLQNEPKAVQTWDSCIYTASEEREYLRNYLAPEMRRQGLSDTEIMIWDHNKERAFERASAIITDDEMKGLVSGVAVHWYSGEHFEQLVMLREAFPDKRIVFSEGCVEYTKFARGDYLNSARMYAHEIIGDMNAGIDAFIHWSLTFDMSGGPNHVNNLCEAVVFSDIENKKAIRTLPYYYIGHFSRFIQPGAARVGFSRYTEKLDVTAFQNPDGERVVVVMNKTGGDIPFILRETDRTCRLTAPGDGILTVCYR